MDKQIPLACEFVANPPGKSVKKPAAPLPPSRRPAKLAQLLALAHHLEALIRRGVVRDRADVARSLGLTRSRITQLLHPTLLAPDIQEEILFAEAIDGVEPFTEREVRQLVRFPM